MIAWPDFGRDGRTRAVKEVAMRASGAALALVSMMTVAFPSGAAATSPPADIAQGLYLTRLADCMACHTKAGGTPFAGGRAIVTAFGGLSSTNLTPDPDTGIGRWSDESFYRAVHDGIGHDGAYLYPVMPYPSYTKMTRADVLSIKAYLFSLKPVVAPRVPSGMKFPYNMRSLMFAWRELYFHPGAFVENPARSAEWNRGAYLVQGPGHCGECHSPRNVLGATDARASLAGGDIEQWLAPNISSDTLDGIGKQSIGEIVTFLHTGSVPSMGVAFGPMAEVVHDSLQFATDADLHAIAVYLKDGPARNGPAIVPAAAAEIAQGKRLYLAECGSCHQDNGRGIAGVVPNLAGNTAIAEDRPTDLIVAVLQGLHRPDDGPQMPSFAGALDDRSIASIANYVRTNWQDHAPANVTPEMVAALRPVSDVGAAGSEAARAFDCPRVGPDAVQGTMADAGEADLLANGDGPSLDRRISDMVWHLRQQQPDMANGQLANTMFAAFCPAVAALPGLSDAEKRARVLELDMKVQQQIASTTLPVGSHVILSAPVSPMLAHQVFTAAAALHETPGVFVSDLVAKWSSAK
jgi:mono/diheme cytochrome c family protein